MFMSDRKPYVTRIARGCLSLEFNDTALPRLQQAVRDLGGSITMGAGDMGIVALKQASLPVTFDIDNGGAVLAQTADQRRALLTLARRVRSNDVFSVDL